MALTYTVTPSSLTIVLGFRPRIIPSSHPNFKQLSELVKKRSATEEQALKLIDIPAAITSFTGGNVTVINGKLYFKGFEVKSSLSRLILDYIKAGDEQAAEPFKRFLEKAYENPDPRAAQDLFDWCLAGGLPITPEGDILAWKMVQNDYFSIRSGKRGKLRHQIGDVVEEPRHETNADPSQTCSVGIHFCSLEYIKKGGYASSSNGRVMAVAVSPADVVAFPRDYQLSKGRCCKLTVVGEVPWSDVGTFYGSARVHDWKQSVSALEAAPAPAPVRYADEADLPVQVGDVWVDRSGRQIAVTHLTDLYTPKHGLAANIKGNPGRSCVWANTGRGNSSISTKDDLITLVSREKFAVGQIWLDRNGTKHTVTEIVPRRAYPVRTDRGAFTKDGEFNGHGRVSAYDLVTKVS